MKTMRVTDRLILLFSIGILMGAAATPVWGADATVTVTNATGLPGELAAVSVLLDTQGVSTVGMQVNLTMDGRVLPVDTLAKGVEIPDPWIYLTNALRAGTSNQEVRAIGVDATSTGKAMNGPILDLTFRIAANASVGPHLVTIATGTQVLDPNSASFNLTTKNGTITVLAPQPPPGDPPTITQDPADQTVTVGQTATFSITATGTDPLSYQWQKGKADIAGATSSGYTTPATTLADNNTMYRCVVTNPFGDAASKEAKLTVNDLFKVETPTISPDGGTFTGSVTVTLSTATSGATIHYTTDGNNPDPNNHAQMYSAPFNLTQSATVKAQAYKSGMNDSGIASASFTINQPPSGNATVKVGNASAEAGKEATFPVEIDTQGQLAGGYQITVTSPGVGVDKNTATITKGPATPDGLFMGNALPDEYRAVWVDTTGNGFPIGKGSAFDVRITVPSSTKPGTYKLELTLATVLRPDGSSFSVSRTAGTLTVSAAPGVPPSITEHPASQTVTEGQTATFSVTATGTAPLSYQWMEIPPGGSHSDIPGATSPSLTFTATLAKNGSTYHCVVYNSAGSVTSNDATLTVKPAPKITITATATPTSGQAPLTVNFAAAASSQDENGNNVPVVLYEWDVKGWGNYAWNSSTTGNMGDYTYTAGRTYLATVRATDARGAQGTYSISLEVTPHPDAPNATLSSNTIEGKAPLKVSFTTRASSVNRIAYIAYDLDGDGRVDYVDDLKFPSKHRDRQQSNVVYLYTEPGLYTALAEVVDNKGLSALKQLPIHVLENPSAAQVTLSVDKTEGVVPLKVTLTPNISNISPTDEPIQLTWYFGDGESRVSTKGELVTHTYSHPGVFEPEVCVRNARSLSTCAHSRVTVADDGNLAHPDARFEAKPPSGNAPLEVTLNRTDKKKVDQLRWIIDGKPHRLFRKGKPENKVTTLFRDVGMHLVQLKALDKSGVAAWESRWIPVGDGKLKVMILGPKAGAVLNGKGVIPIIAAVDSRLENVKVDFQIAAGEHNRDGHEQDWMSIGVVTQPPYVLLWDTAQKGEDGKPLYEDGKYALRIVVNDATHGILVSPVRPVKIDEAEKEPDLEKNVAREKEHSRWNAKAVTEEAHEVMLGDQTVVEVPVDLVQAGPGRLTIVALDPSQVSAVLSTSDPNVMAAGIYYQIDLVDPQKNEPIHELEQPLRICVPYEADEKGNVKGTDIPQETLSLYWYDESTQRWVPLPTSIVNAQIGTVEATTPHLSLFGLGGLLGSVFGGGGGGGGAVGATVGAVGGAAGGSGGGGSGCSFLVILAGSPTMTVDLATLRAFRDVVLMESTSGQAFVRWYYRHSPPVARFIEDKPALRWLVRQLLKPLIRYAKKAV